MWNKKLHVSKLQLKKIWSCRKLVHLPKKREKKRKENRKYFFLTWKMLDFFFIFFVSNIHYRLLVKKKNPKFSKSKKDISDFFLFFPLLFSFLWKMINVSTWSDFLQLHFTVVEFFIPHLIFFHWFWQKIEKKY